MSTKKLRELGIDERDEREATIVRPLIEEATPSQAPDRMSNGMTGTEAVHRASQWWDTLGRHMVKPQSNFDRIRDDIVVRSAILNALPWSQLDRRERYNVVKHWYRTFKAEEEGKLVDDRIVDHRGSTKKVEPNNKIH